MLLDFDDNGPGPVVVLLHGFPLDRSLWAGQVASIGTIYRLITPDLRGHGTSAAPEGTYSIDAMADDVIELLDALQLRERVVLGGHSMGGYIALSAILRYPERFRGLMLVDTKAAADTTEAADGRLKQASQVESSGDTAGVVGASASKLFSPETGSRNPKAIEATMAVMGRTVPRAVAGALRGMAERPDRTADLSRIGVPTLIVVGEDDKVTPPQEAQAMADQLAEARVVVIPSAGHAAPIENPEAVSEAMLAFLNGLEATR